MKTWNEFLDAQAALPAPTGYKPRAGILFPEVPRPGHPAFVGPRPQFRMAAFYDPRPNVSGRTYWGD